MLFTMIISIFLPELTIYAFYSCTWSGSTESINSGSDLRSIILSLSRFSSKQLLHSWLSTSALILLSSCKVSIFEIDCILRVLLGERFGLVYVTILCSCFPRCQGKFSITVSKLGGILPCTCFDVIRAVFFWARFFCYILSSISCMVLPRVDFWVLKLRIRFE